MENSGMFARRPIKCLTNALFLVIIVLFLVLFADEVTRYNRKSKSAQDEDLVWTPEVKRDFKFPGLVTHSEEYNLKGCIFVDSPHPCVDVSHKITTSLIHKWTPHFEEQVERKFVDPPADNDYFVLSPAVAIKGDRLHVYARVMLDRLRYRYHKVKKFPLNQFMTNYIYTETFGPDMLSLDHGELVGIPTPLFPLDGDGPMDPRVFTWNSRHYLMMLVFTHIDDHLWKPHPLIWDVERSKMFVPKVNLTYDPKSPMEKNWSPLVSNNTLYLVHNLDPLRILQCDMRAPVYSCDFVVDESPGESFVFERRRHVLRGGTPFILYKWPYYIALAHSVTIPLRPDAPFGRVRRYEANLVVMRVSPQPRVVYVSNALKFHEDLYANISMVYYEGQIMVENDFVYPVSLIRESSDSLAFGAHIKDHISVMLRMTGIREVMAAITALDDVTKGHVEPLTIQDHVKKKFP